MDRPELVDALPYIDQGYEDLHDKQTVSKWSNDHKKDQTNSGN